jgi:glutaredoxin
VRRAALLTSLQQRPGVRRQQRLLLARLHEQPVRPTRVRSPLQHGRGLRLERRLHLAPLQQRHLRASVAARALRRYCEKVAFENQLRRSVALVALLGACHPGLNVTTEQLDALHAHCSERISRGYAVTQRPNLLGRAGPPKPAGTPAIVYGAAWCDACDTAKAYLRRRDIPFVEYDIETDAVANGAMEAKLAAAGIDSSDSLPVVDVRGTIMTAFMPCAIDAAWGET